MNIIAQALIISLSVLFIHATTWKGMLFEGIKKLIKPEGMTYKPIYGCPICMCPYYGTLIYWLLFSVGWMDWILTIGAASGLSVIYVVLIDLKDAAITYIKETKEDNEHVTTISNDSSEHTTR